MTVRLVIVDDHPVVRDGLRGMFVEQADLEIVGEAGDGERGLAVAERERPDVVLTDLRMPGLAGAEFIRLLAERVPSARVLVLTTYDGDDNVLPAVAAGAIGYLLKDSPREEVFRAVRAAAVGETVLSPAVAARVLNQVRAPAPAELTEREHTVLGLVARGSTNKEAAAALFISETTVKTHLAHIYAKLGVSDRAAAVATAFSRGLLP
ncbi:DNA-binding response regulator, NarL/FixJ family, contains REC and HTH domains [Nonomuraea solani]|uniref:DNA-binding response regulator, NarL/FixJ family, contains REC and HTH domains n=1 Tax=Nonomuraea solani TaxID=1144553 RepID=A0A1H5YEE7_9ACTN|nr:response regulator transcription factor [Nonomuraea solani]SEG22469.1 DNA-binding response regulator, NarL/FixJ family, contains REC and HTH domains [Nonomuraea solani]